jgi:hypothetical protein
MVRYTALGKETSFQDAVAATTYLNAKCSDTPNNNLVTPKPVSTIHEYDCIIGPYTNQGRIDEFYVKPDNVGDLLMALFGTDTPAQQGGTAAYLHTFTFNDTPPSYTIRKGVELDEEILAGCLFNKLAVKFSSKDGVKASADFYNTKTKTSGVIGTPTLSTLPDFPCMNLSALSGNLKIADDDKKSLIYDCEITIERAIPYNNVFSLDSREMPAKYSGGVSVTGKLSAIFNSDLERDRMLAGTSFKLEASIASSVIASTYYYSLGFELRNCRYSEGCSPAVTEQGEPLIADMPFHAYYDSSGGFNSSIKAYLQNTKTSAY